MKSFHWGQALSLRRPLTRHTRSNTSHCALGRSGEELQRPEAHGDGLRGQAAQLLPARHGAAVLQVRAPQLGRAHRQQQVRLGPLPKSLFGRASGLYLFSTSEPALTCAWLCAGISR